MNNWSKEQFKKHFKENKSEVLLKSKFYSELALMKPIRSSEISFGTQ